MDKQFFWKDLSGRGFTNTFTLEELFDAIPDDMIDCDECHGHGVKDKSIYIGEEFYGDMPVECGFCEDGKVPSDESISVWTNTAEVGDTWSDTTNHVIRIK